MQKSSRILILVLIILVLGITNNKNEASARWVLREGPIETIERVCRNGMISSLYVELWDDDGYEIIDYVYIGWEHDPSGLEWESISVFVTHSDSTTEPLILKSVSEGPPENDHINGLNHVSRYHLLRWENSLVPGDEVAIVFTPQAQSPWYSPGVSLSIGVSGYFPVPPGIVEDCTIPDNLPAPSHYNFCKVGSAPANPVINFPADLNIFDVNIALVSTYEGEISANLSSPNGENINLFNNLSPPTIGNCGLSDVGDYINGGPALFMDDEGDSLADYAGWGGYFAPVEKLSILDGTSTVGAWTLTLTDAMGNSAADSLNCWCIDVLGYRTVRFASSNYEANENDGTTKILVELSETSTEITTVEYAASVGIDSNQSMQAGTLTFLPGSKTREITLNIVDDLLPEPNELIELSLSQPGNQYGIGAPGLATLTILDNDQQLFFPIILR